MIDLEMISEIIEASIIINNYHNHYIAHTIVLSVLSEAINFAHLSLLFVWALWWGGLNWEDKNYFDNGWLRDEGVQ